MKKIISLNLHEIKRKYAILSKRFFSIHLLLRLIQRKRDNLRRRLLKAITPYFYKITPNIQEIYGVKEIVSTTFRIYDPIKKVYLEVAYDSYGLPSLSLKAYQKNEKCHHDSNLDKISRNLLKRGIINEL